VHDTGESKKGQEGTIVAQITTEPIVQ
jgi:hypothetical protein